MLGEFVVCSEMLKMLKYKCILSWGVWLGVEPPNFGGPSMGSKEGLMLVCKPQGPV